MFKLGDIIPKGYIKRHENLSRDGVRRKDFNNYQDFGVSIPFRSKNRGRIELRAPAFIPPESKQS